MAERTKLWIASVMKKLMERKPIEKIRVTEICKAAEIERPTFYYHFRDKYDLVAWIFFQSAFDTDILSVDSAARSLNRARMDFAFFERAYEDKSPMPLWQYMVEYFVDRYSRAAMEILGTDTLDTQLRYSIRLYCYGTVNMTREWILKDKITPAETAVRMMFNSMPESLRRIYFPDEEEKA